MKLAGDSTSSQQHIIPKYDKFTCCDSGQVTTKKQDIKRQMEGIISKESMVVVHWSGSDTQKFGVSNELMRFK